ncbi:hypothetical protein ABNF65_07935 [Paenibacillus larvae]
MSKYLDIPSVDRLGVAADVLAQRNSVSADDTNGVEAKQFKDVNAVKKAVETAALNHDNALKAVNALNSKSLISNAVAALKQVGNEAFNKMNAVEQATIAENFLAKCDFSGNDGALKVQFKTLEAVKALMK